MPITTLDPRTALIVIDLQKGIVAFPTAHPTANVIANASLLAEAFRAHHLPVVLVYVDPTPHGRSDQPPRMLTLPAGFTDLVPELNQQPTDHLVTKHSWNAFIHTDLAAYLAANDITQVVIVGVATSVGVESTARHAYELGLNVTLARDAMTDMHLDAHTNSFTRIFPRIAEIGTTADILAFLERF